MAFLHLGDSSEHLSHKAGPHDTWKTCLLMESEFSGLLFLCRICVVFIVYNRIEDIGAVEGEYLPHWGEVLWVKILAEALPDATSQTENCLFGNSQGHSQGGQSPTETFPNGTMCSFVLSTAKEEDPQRFHGLMLVRDTCLCESP